MTQEDIIRMAREAGLYTKCEVHSAVPFDQLLESFAALVAAAESDAFRAELTRIVVVPTLTHGTLVKLSDVDTAIRARGQA